MLKFQGKGSHPQKRPHNKPNWEQFARAVCPSLSACLLFNLRERGRTVFTNSSEHCLRKLLLLGQVFLLIVSFFYGWSLLLTAIWLGLFDLRLKFGFVFFVCSGNWFGLFFLWSPPSRNSIWSSLLMVPPKRTGSKNALIVSKEDASFLSGWVSLKVCGFPASISSTSPQF